MVLQDGSIELSDRPGGPGDNKQMTFDLPDNFTVVTSEALVTELALMQHSVPDNVRPIRRHA